MPSQCTGWRVYRLRQDVLPTCPRIYLDYFKTMEAYFDAKKSFFTSGAVRMPR